MKEYRIATFWTLSLVTNLVLGLSPTRLIAFEYALVTGPQAYVVDRDGNIEYIQPQHQLVKFLDDKGDYLLIPDSGGDRIRKGLVHVLPELSLLNEDKPLRYNEQQLLRDAFRILRDATKLSNEDKHAVAIELAEDAKIKADFLFSFMDSPHLAYFLENLAYIEHVAGKAKLAEKHLDEAEKYLKQIADTGSLAASELHNIRGIIAQEAGQPEQAITLFRKAIDLTKAKVGKFHLDHAVLQSNLASAYADAGDTEKAVSAQNEALSILINLLPKPALEIPVGYTELGLYLTDDGKHDTAIKAFEIAILDHATNHLDKHPVEVANTRLGLADAYLAKQDFKRAKSSLDQGMRIELTKMQPLDKTSYRKEFLYRLALVYYDQDQHQQAMTHLREAAKLHQQKTEESVDGSTYSLIGHVHDFQGKSAKARQAYQTAFDIYTRVEGKESTNAREVAEWLAELE